MFIRSIALLLALVPTLALSRRLGAVHQTRKSQSFGNNILAIIA